MAFPQMVAVENLSAMQETLSSNPGLGRDPLEKGMATLPSVLAWRTPWRTPWRKEPGKLQSVETQSAGHS